MQKKKKKKKNTQTKNTKLHHKGSSLKVIDTY